MTKDCGDLGTGSNGLIGKDQSLPWHLPELKIEITTGHAP